MSSSHSTSQSQAASRTYRIRNLRKAKIYIDQLEACDWPEWVVSLVNTLTCNNFTNIAPPEAADWLGVSSPSIFTEGVEEITRQIGQEAFRQTHLHHTEVRRLQGRVESFWRDFSFGHILHPLLDAVGVENCRDQTWDEPVEIIEGELVPLSTPKPDVGFGLTVQDHATDARELQNLQLPQLMEDDLTILQIHARLHPWPSMGLPNLAFPGLVYECKSDSKPIYFAENQAAGAAAKALRMLEDLHGVASSDGVTPVFVMCSQGALWKIFVAFRKNSYPLDGIHLVLMWSGDITQRWSHFQLYTIVLAIRNWLSKAYRIEIAELVGRAKATLH